MAVQVKVIPQEEKGVCRRCHRKLKSKKAIERGFGDTCYKKYIKKSSLFLFEMEVNNEKNN